MKVLLEWLASPKAQAVIAGAKFWRKHHIGRHLMGFFANRRQKRAERQAARRREAEGAATEGQFQLDEDETMNLRTSTGAGLAGIAVNIIIQLMQMVPATADLAQDPSFAAGLTAVVMWAVARKWKTPETPGKV